MTADLVPFDNGGLTVGNNILIGSVHFLKDVARTDKDILEYSDAACIGYGIFVNGKIAIGGAVEMEGKTFNQAILSGLAYLKTAPAENIAEGYGCGFAVRNGNRLGCLRCVKLGFILGNRINAGEQIVDIDNSVIIGDPVDALAFAGDGEANARHITILRGFHKVKPTFSQGVVEVDGCGFAANDGYGLRRLRGVKLGFILGHGVGAGLQIRNVDNAVCIRNAVNINAVAGDSEANARYISIFRCFNEMQTSTANGIVEAYRCGLAAYDGYGLRCLRCVELGFVFGNRISSGNKGGDVDNAVCIGHSVDGLSLTFDGEAYVCDIAVLCRFYKMQASRTAAKELEAAVDGIAYGRAVGYRGLVIAAGPGYNAAAFAADPARVYLHFAFGHGG